MEKEMTLTVRLLASGDIVLCFMVGADELELENISLLLSLTFVSGYGLIPAVNRGLFL